MGNKHIENEYPEMEFDIHEHEDYTFVTIYDHDGSYSNGDPSSYDFTIDYESIFDDIISQYGISYDEYDSIFENFMNQVIENLCRKFYDFTQIGRCEGNFYGEGRGVDELKSINGFNDGIKRIREISYNTIKELRKDECNSDIFRNLVNYIGLIEKIYHYEKIFNYNIPNEIRNHLGERYQKMPEESEILTEDDMDNLTRLIDDKILNGALKPLKNVNGLNIDINDLLSEKLGIKNIILEAYKHKESYKIPGRYENEFIDKIRELRLKQN